ncbi:hypothetical protein ACHAXA_009028 [Cyclostephanos tholiformis]|uniref:Uncharacterized protein n=1 Tax=Cyclostephanos tholiformis TaxID=382380 RepID=A0ABD3RTD1_9STRA
MKRDIVYNNEDVDNPIEDITLTLLPVSCCGGYEYSRSQARLAPIALSSFMNERYAVKHRTDTQWNISMSGATCL